MHQRVALLGLDAKRNLKTTRKKQPRVFLWLLLLLFLFMPLKSKRSADCLCFTTTHLEPFSVLLPCSQSCMWSSWQIGKRRTTSPTTSSTLSWRLAYTTLLCISGAGLWKGKGATELFALAKYWPGTFIKTQFYIHSYFNSEIIVFLLCPSVPSDPEQIYYSGLK